MDEVVGQILSGQFFELISVDRCAEKNTLSY